MNHVENKSNKTAAYHFQIEYIFLVVLGYLFANKVETSLY